MNLEAQIICSGQWWCQGQVPRTDEQSSYGSHCPGICEADDQKRPGRSSSCAYKRKLRGANSANVVASAIPNSSTHRWHNFGQVKLPFATCT